MISELVELTMIKPHGDNPRDIKKDKLKKLKESISDFPEMLDLRPLVVDENNVILGGNMRYHAAKELGLKEIPIVRVLNFSEEQKKEFVIKDNVSFGEWDWDKLANEWEQEQLTSWGMDVFMQEEDEDEKYTGKIEAPVYEPSQETVYLDDLVNTTKSVEMIEEIESADIPEELKGFLKIAANRHNVFDYAKIADFYAKASKEVQDLMERSALVVIDFDKAIENGYLELTEDTLKNYSDENGK